MELTSSYSELNLDVTGYMLNAELVNENKILIADLHQKFVVSNFTFGRVL